MGYGFVGWVMVFVYVGGFFGLGRECVRVLVKCGVYVVFVVRRVDVFLDVKFFIIVEILIVCVECMFFNLIDMKFVCSFLEE